MMLTPTLLLWRAVGEFSHPDAAPDPRPCAVCGRHGTELPSVDADSFFPDTFNDRDVLTQGTGRICIACVAYYQRAGRGKTLRSTHLVVTASRVEEADTPRMLALCSGHDVPAPPFAATVATSYKKHLLPRARVATRQDAFPVTLELENGICDPAKFCVVASIVREMRELDLSPDEIQTRRPETRKLATFAALRAWQRCDLLLKPWRGTFIFRLALRLVTMPKKEEPECPKKRSSRTSLRRQRGC